MHVWFQTAYNPNLRYSNGEDMPPRPRNLFPTNFDLFYISDIKNYEKRVAEAIDFGYVYDVSVRPNAQSPFNFKRNSISLNNMLFHISLNAQQAKNYF
jgi:hypothetical protein